MKISIEYCGEWNYLPKAAGLAKALKDKYNINAELIKSSGGVFEVVKDGKLIFSKRAKGRFPDDGEIFSIIDKDS